VASAGVESKGQRARAEPLVAVNELAQGLPAIANGVVVAGEDEDRHAARDAPLVVWRPHAADAEHQVVDEAVRQRLAAPRVVDVRAHLRLVAAQPLEAGGFRPGKGLVEAGEDGKEGLGRGIAAGLGQLGFEARKELVDIGQLATGGARQHCTREADAEALKVVLRDQPTHAVAEEHYGLAGVAGLDVAGEEAGVGDDGVPPAGAGHAVAPEVCGRPAVTAVVIGVDRVAGGDKDARDSPVSTGVFRRPMCDLDHRPGRHWWQPPVHEEPLTIGRIQGEGVVLLLFLRAQIHGTSSPVIIGEVTVMWPARAVHAVVVPRRIGDVP
jgi:hypothetical protein